jgi:hypothetical protein
MTGFPLYERAYWGRVPSMENVSSNWLEGEEMVMADLGVASLVPVVLPCWQAVRTQMTQMKKKKMCSRFIKN